MKSCTVPSGHCHPLKARPTKTQEERNGKVVGVGPQACDYSGLCEVVSLTQSITRPFEIVIPGEQDDETVHSNSTKVVENH